jgi:hypothetical protein
MSHGDAREGKWRGNWQMEWVASTLHTTSEHGVSSITTADARTSAASSRPNWRPRRFKWTRPFPRKTKSGFCTVPSHFKRSLQYFKIPWYFLPSSCGEMFTTDRQTTRHAETSHRIGSSWTYDCYVVFSVSSNLKLRIQACRKLIVSPSSRPGIFSDVQCESSLTPVKKFTLSFKRMSYQLFQFKTFFLQRAFDLSSIMVDMEHLSLCLYVSPT